MFVLGKKKIHHSSSAIDNVNEVVEKRCIALSMHVDLTKAFDLINHRLLLKKLRVYRLNNAAMKLFESYLVGRKQLVKINLMSGLTFSDALDLTQGSILGPLLFINFKNDLPDFVNFPTYSFADDTSTILCEKEATSQLEEVFHKVKYGFNVCMLYNSDSSICIKF